MNSIPKHCVLSILTLVGLVTANGVNTVNAEQRPLTAPMAGTFRIRSQVAHGDNLITGHGTAWGVNLAEFGYDRHQYVMTACHVVREHDGSLCPNLQLEMRRNGGVHWARLRLVASDSKMDVAVLECENELPVCSNIAERNAVEQTQVAMIGSPGGVPLKVLRGYVTGNKKTEPSVAYVEYIQEGCSGGPIFDTRTQDVIGLVIAGIGVGSSQKMDPHTCLYVSVANMKHFLRTSLKPNGEEQSMRRNAPKEHVIEAPPENKFRRDRDHESHHQRRNDEPEHTGPRHRDPTCDSCMNEEFFTPVPTTKQCPTCKKGDLGCVDRSGVWLP